MAYSCAAAAPQRDPAPLAGMSKSVAIAGIIGGHLLSGCLIRDAS
jgi:hypothetical protein